MSADRFNPDPKADYGHCLVCPATFAAAEEANAHMSATFEEAKAKGESSGHRVRITNPSRGRRIESEISRLISYAIDGVMCDIDRLVDRGDITEDEAKVALCFHPDFADAREEWEQS